MQKANDILRYNGSRKADIRFQDGALMHSMGTKHYQVLRSTRSTAHQMDGTGWTYNHAPMLAWWKDNFYLSYLSNPVSEHEAPGQVLFTRSSDGSCWEKLRVLFPPIHAPSAPYRGPKKELLPTEAPVVMHHRTVFYPSSENRLLATTFYGFSPDNHLAPNNGWGIGRVVREVYEDSSLSPIYFIRYNTPGGYSPENIFIHPSFEASEDEGFVSACRELLNNRLVTQQWWEEEREDKSGFFTLPDVNALCCYTLPNGKTLGVGKNAISSLSEDGGESWSCPSRSATIETGTGKVWGQRMSDKRYALVYNPSTDSAHRWPLAIVTGENGQDFENLLALTPEISPCRYTGNLKNLGAQYVRGIGEFCTQPPDGKLWLCYSVNKEDIWVCSVEVPVRGAESFAPAEELTNPDIGTEAWSFFSPLWCPVNHLPREGGIRLKDSDLYNRAIAERAFPAAKTGEITAKLKITEQAPGSSLLVSLQDGEGRTPLEVSFKHDGQVRSMNSGRWHDGCCFSKDVLYELCITFNTAENKAVIMLKDEDKTLWEYPVLFSQSVTALERIRFATKLNLPWQTLREAGNTMALGDLAGGEEPTDISTYWIYSLFVREG